jgi:general stress protein 26
MSTLKFEEIAKTFDERVRKIVWCTVTTVDTAGRPYSRILHPIWEGQVGWIATGRQTLKAKHVARNANVSLFYWTAEHNTVFAQCRAEWADDAATKQRIWNLFKSTPEPVGYDPIMAWKGGVTDPTFGVLKLTPSRIELWTAADMAAGKRPTIWTA